MEKNGRELRGVALAQARELQELLEQVATLPEFGEGSCPAFALDALDEVIAYLIEDEPEQPRPPLRLVAGR